MKTLIITLAVVSMAPGTSSFAAQPEKIKITTSAFSDGGEIPSKFTCDGANVSPPLQITAVPKDAKSLVLIVDDPDAPGGLFTHWTIWNIDPKTNLIAEAAAPAGVQGTNDFNKSGYGAPCPPFGSHRYYFKIYALDRQLELKPGARRREIDAAIKGHVIAEGQIMGRYSKQK